MPTNVIEIAADTAARMDIGLFLNYQKSRIYTRDAIPLGIPVLGTVRGGNRDEPGPSTRNIDPRMTPALSDTSEVGNVDMQPACPQTPPALDRP